MQKTTFHEEEFDRRILIRSNYATAGPDRPYGENIYQCQGVPDEKPVFNLIPVKPGIALMISHFTPKCRMNMDFEMEHSPVQFGYCLKGKCLHNMYGLCKGKKELWTRPGFSNTFYTPDTCGDCEIQPNDEQLMVGLQIDPRLFREMLEPEMENHPCLCRRFAKWNCRTKFAHQTGMTPAMNSVAFQIINCPYQGIVKNLFYESKAVELLSLQIEKIITDGGKPGPSGKLNKSDVERLHAAAEILIQDLTNPPTLAGLARQTGLNEFKLKTGFKDIFGTTVFGYLRSHKMEKARCLLEAGELNVGETAWQVGYSNVSHFITAYRKQYGLNPGDILK